MKDKLTGAVAHDNYCAILQVKAETALRLIELGKLFKENRDNALYELLGYDTFKEFIATPELGFAQSTVYSFIHIYEKFIEQLKQEPKLLCTIGMNKLQIIQPVVSNDPEEWLAKAEALSPSDLINEVREAQGKEPMEPKKPKPESVKLFGCESYLDYVKEHACILHPLATAEPHHFPRTTGAGAEEWHIIPLCRDCHSRYHQHPQEFLWVFKYAIFNYFYGIIGQVFNAR